MTTIKGRITQIVDYKGYEIHVRPRLDCERWMIEATKDGRPIFITHYGYHNPHTGIMRAKRKIDKEIRNAPVGLKVEYIFALSDKMV